jgi:hypothetical protein
VNAQDPPGTEPLPIIYPTAQGYADRNWGAYWYGWRILTEFAQAGWIGNGEGQITMPSPTDDPRAEIERLFLLARSERADAMDEIVAQKDEFISYFMALLSSSPHSRPYTHRLISAASLIALFVAMHFKAVHRRQRPSALYPLLMPPIQVPGHASYPSGHATQSQLISRCVSGLLLVNLPADTQMVITNHLDKLARRIALNREIGGLHYGSDSTEGQALANAIFAKLEADLKLPENERKVPSFAETVAKAIAEWP